MREQAVGEATLKNPAFGSELDALSGKGFLSTSRATVDRVDEAGGHVSGDDPTAERRGVAVAGAAHGWHGSG